MSVPTAVCCIFMSIVTTAAVVSVSVQYVHSEKSIHFLRKKRTVASPEPHLKHLSALSTPIYINMHFVHALLRWQFLNSSFFKYFFYFLTVETKLAASPVTE